jgi:GNAT superfamily N-acetyltransferase
MIKNKAYRKMVTLKNGERVLIRSLNGQDRDGLLKLFRDAPHEDVESCQEDLKNPQVVEHWLSSGPSSRSLCLVAVELKTEQPIAILTLYQKHQDNLKVGEVQNIFVSRSFQGLGLGSLLLDKLVELALQENIHWLKVKVPVEQNHVMKAFLARDFEVRATLEDFFINRKGIPHDMALMMRPLVKKGDEYF